MAEKHQVGAKCPLLKVHQHFGHSEGITKHCTQGGVEDAGWELSSALHR